MKKTLPCRFALVALLTALLQAASAQLTSSTPTTVAGRVDALNAIVTNKITLSVTASGSTTCSGDTCTSTGTTTTKATCSASSAPAPGGPLAAFGAVFAMALAAARRRSKR